MEFCAYAADASDIWYTSAVTLQSIIQQKPSLAWYIADTAKMSDASVVEHVLQYGDWHDFQLLLQVAGTKRTAELFNQTVKKKRSNYSPQIQHYFELYFQKYA